MRLLPFAAALTLAATLALPARANEPMPDGPYRFFINTNYVGPFGTFQSSSIIGFTSLAPDGTFAGAQAFNVSIDDLAPVSAGGLTYEKGNNVSLYNGSNVVIHSGTVQNIIANDSSTITLTTGHYTDVHNQSVPSEGEVAGLMEGWGNAHLVVGNGTALVVATFENSTAQISGGAVGNPLNAGGVFAHGTSTVTVVSGATVQSLFSTDSATIIASGGFLGESTAEGKSTIIASGADFASDLVASGGNVTLSGGEVAANLTAQNGGMVSFSAGTVHGSLLSDGQASDLNISGGSAHDISVTNGGTMDVSGNPIIGGAAACSGDGSDLGLHADASYTSVTASDGGTINMGAGTHVTGSLIAFSTGHIFMNGGTVDGSVEAHEFSTVDFHGGSAPSAAAIDHATLTLSGGTTSSVSASQFSSMFILDGTVNGGVTLNDLATLTFGGGTVNGALTANNSSGAVMQGDAALASLSAHNSSFLLLFGGTISGNVEAFDSSAIDIDGTTIGGSINVHGNARVTLDEFIVIPPGSSASRIHHASSSLPQIFLFDNASLLIDGISLNAQLLNPNAPGGFSEYHLSGLFSDASPIPDIDLFVANPTPANPSGASFAFSFFSTVPEPSTLLMLLPALLPLATRRRRLHR